MQKTRRASGFTDAKQTAVWIEQTNERRSRTNGAVPGVARAKVATVKRASDALIGEHHQRERGQHLAQWDQRAKRLVPSSHGEFQRQGAANREVAAAGSTQCAQIRPRAETFTHVASE